MVTGYSFWDKEIVAPQHVSWLEDAGIRDYANELIGGSTPAWPVDWFNSWLHGRRFRRALSIGCGGGVLDRILVARDFVQTIDGFDGSISSLHLAQREAAKEGLEHRIHYYAADFNEPTLPAKTYDLVIFHQSAHHVAKLEKLFRHVLRSLTPDGLVYLDEYVGPSRFSWTDELLAPQRAIYKALPEAVRTTNDIPYPIQEDDPSEAYRSNEIEPQLHIGFKVLQRRPYGGTLLALVYPLLRRDRLHPDIIASLIAAEKQLLARGLPSYYAVIVARPRRGVAKMYADLHYFAIPKLKRVLREMRARRVLAKSTS